MSDKLLLREQAPQLMAMSLGELQATQQRLSSAQALSSKPFIWNSEPEFVAARMGIGDAMYS
jgi:hypothetical protein